MKPLKINILFKFIEGPWGGGNQFLKALRNELIKQSLYEDQPEAADAIIFNGYPFRAEDLFDQLYELKKNGPHKILIYRMDGPVSLIRGKDAVIDEITTKINGLFFDGIIYQSEWCKEKNKSIFGYKTKYETVINNAPDHSIFNTKDTSLPAEGEKLKLISSSWSKNLRKGFEIYRFLDEHLDFSHYEMTFVGNSPFRFKNIRQQEAVSSRELAKLLKRHHVYITASQNDPCSNAVIEALSCGLPALGLNDGGHPELIRDGGEVFNNTDELMSGLEKIKNNYADYKNRLPEYKIEKTAAAYVDFIKQILHDNHANTYHPKTISINKTIQYKLIKLRIAKRNLALRGSGLLKRWIGSSI